MDHIESPILGGDGNREFLMLLKRHWDTESAADAMTLFWYSIRYIMWLFLILLVDHFAVV